jgi:glutamine synthetase type III
VILLANEVSYILFFAGIALLIFTLMRRHIRRQSQVTKESKSHEKKPFADTRPVATKDVGLLDAPDEISRWEVAMHETARDLKAELDSKIRVVQTLVQMAQQESDRLETAVAEARRAGVIADSDPIEQIEKLADRLLDVGQQASAETLPLDERDRLQVQQLLKQGMTPTAIAKKIQRPVADIELTIEADRSAN